MEETKKCPYCGEEILTAAKKCKHCGEWLYEAPQRFSVQKNNDGCLGIIWKTTVVIITIVVVLALLPIIGEILMLVILSAGS